MRDDLPTGTVTFLFTDVAGSTKLLDDHGDGYADLLADHREVVRTALSPALGSRGGHAGRRVLRSLRASGDAVARRRRDLALAGPRPRSEFAFGIHTGEAARHQGGYVGLDVHRAARIASAGTRWASRSLRRRATSSAPSISCASSASTGSRIWSRAERLFQLGDGEVPTTLGRSTLTNLPVAVEARSLGRERGGSRARRAPSGVQGLSRSVGQAASVNAARASGGSGTSGHRLGRHLLGPARLAHRSEPRRKRSSRRRSVRRTTWVALLRDRELVLLLDNFEHLLSAAPTIADLMAGAAGLRVLVTSRAPLRVTGEVEYLLEPLEPTDAVALFVERARAVGRATEPSAAVEAICARLDGLPLAIELAAARARLLAPEALLGRLERALPLLTDGSRDAPERQRTLRATIEWSYKLLDDESRRLLARLAVFAGSFPIEAAESVATPASASSRRSLTSACSSRSATTVCSCWRRSASTRWSGWSNGRGQDLSQPTRRSVLRLAESAYELRGEAEADWSSGLERDHDDLRAALDWFRKRMWTPHSSSPARSAGSGSRAAIWWKVTPG